MNDDNALLAIIAIVVFIFGIAIGSIAAKGFVIDDCKVMKSFRNGQDVYICEVRK